MPEITKRSVPPVLIILLCSFVVLVVMQPWNLYFLNDDFEHIPAIAENLIVRKNFLRPIPNLFLALDKFLYNKWAPGYFVTTWILHTSCAIGVYFLVRSVIEHFHFQIAPSAALIASLFFLFYPFHAEPLFWIIGRGSVIATLFAILSLHFCINKSKNRYYLFTSLLLFILALLSYESVWNLIFIYVLISIINAKKYSAVKRIEFLHLGIFLAIFFAYLFVRYLLLNTLTGDYAEVNNNIFRTSFLFINLVKLVARNFTPPFNNSIVSVIFFCASIILYSGVTLLIFRRNRLLGWLTIVLWLGLVTAVITATPLGIDTHGNESERYIYYSSFFFCFFLALGVTFFNSKKWQYLICSIIITVSTIGLIIVNNNYRFASIVTKKTLGLVKKYPNFRKAYFVNVPGEYKGALIFRVCLPNAIRWVDSGCKYDSVLIVNVKEDAKATSFFETGEKTWEELGDTTNFTSTESKLDNEAYGNDAVVFWYTESGVYKVKK